MSRRTRIAGVLIGTSLLAACFAPEDRRPGLALPGELQDEHPDDWAFTDENREIAIEVRTPYWIPHSVTIWCASVDGDLYVGARDPETKNWPGWADRDPRVRLLIDGRIFEGQLLPVDDPARIERIRAAYRQKYDLEEMSPRVRYWQFGPANDA
jgi:hypothetical protein